MRGWNDFKQIIYVVADYISLQSTNELKPGNKRITSREERLNAEMYTVLVLRL